MDVAPGFAEPGRRIKTGNGKKGRPAHACTSTGVFFFGDFLLDKQKKVTRYSRAAASEIVFGKMEWCYSFSNLEVSYRNFL